MAETLIETVRVIDGLTPLWPLHRWRLLNSALALGVALPEIEPPAGANDRVARLELADGLARWADREVEPTTELSLWVSPAPHRGYAHKIGSRAWLEAACTTGQATGADDALLFDAQDRLVEAPRWAIGWWEGEHLCFPPFALGGLRSVARARLTEMARGGVREGILRRDDLAKRSFLACNAARGVVSVTILNGTPIVADQRTAALARRFWTRADA